MAGGESVDALRVAKDALRAEMHAVRAAIPAEARASRSRQIAERLLATAEIERTRHCLTFLSFGSEVSTGPILVGLRARGIAVAVPVLEEGNMEAVELSRGARLIPSSYGAKEPATRAVVAPEEIDLVVAPGLAFDRLGGRIGYGGGYFDGFLRRVRSDCTVAGVCFAEQIVDEVPAGPDDVAVGLVVSDAEVIRPANL